MTQPVVIIVPGLGNSGPEHWQSYWESSYPGATRVVQDDWERPELQGWVARLQDTIERVKAPVVLVAHSLACSLVGHWAVRHGPGRVRAALLVSPADVDSPAHTPAEVRGFAPMPLARLRFNTTVIASEDDPYVDLGRARAFAAAWGAQFVCIGKAGHINAQSGLGPWMEGQGYLRKLMET